jgi:membrane fusion protein (multidrug efflux system)
MCCRLQPQRCKGSNALDSTRAAQFPNRVSNVRIVLAVAAAAFLIAGCSKEAAPPQRPVSQVTVLEVKPQSIPFTPSFVAQTESSRQVNIVGRVSGFLDKIAYQEGELVKEGQVLFQLDPKPFKAQLESAQGEFDAAKASVFSAQAKVTQAELNLGYATIRSPVTGLASRALQRQGSYINSMSDSANLTYVAAVDPIWVTFSVSQNQLAQWNDEFEKKQLIKPKNGDYTVELVLPDGARYPHTGKINFADPSFSQETGSFQVRAVLPNPKRDLRPGMFVTANLQGTVRPGAIVLPQLAVQQGSNGQLVYVVKQDGTAEVRPVIVGNYEGEKDIVILSGLHAGDRVVVDGMLRVVPGQPVSVVEPGQTGAAKVERAKE